MHVSRSLRAVLVVATACCVVGRAATAATGLAPTTRPATRPAAAAAAAPATAPSTRPIDPALQAEIEAGRAAAQKDLAAGVLKFQQGVPESFLLSWMAGEEGGDPLEYYAALLADRYGVQHGWTMVHAATPDRRAWLAGYNRVMIPAIEKRHGAGVLDKTWAEAARATPAQRKAYLKARPATRAATRPSSAPAPPRAPAGRR